MIGYKVLSKDGLKGPFKKSSIIKAITSAMVPLQARLLDLSTGRYIFAAELVGEQIDPRQNTHTEPRQQQGEDGLVLDEDAKPEVVETPRVILKGKIPLKKLKLPRLPKPRKPAQSDPDELELNHPAA
ncbi:MAG: hypothetical protein KDB82_18625 [Planctomycetes bacterium]|nr:hypothetical protein [Planctomycetota bacterium]